MSIHLPSVTDVCYVSPVKGVAQRCMCNCSKAILCFFVRICSSKNFLLFGVIHVYGAQDECVRVYVCTLVLCESCCGVLFVHRSLPSMSGVAASTSPSGILPPLFGKPPSQTSPQGPLPSPDTIQGQRMPSPSPPMAPPPSTHAGAWFALTCPL